MPAQPGAGKATVMCSIGRLKSMSHHTASKGCLLGRSCKACVFQAHEGSVQDKVAAPQQALHQKAPGLGVTCTVIICCSDCLFVQYEQPYVC